MKVKQASKYLFRLTYRQWHDDALDEDEYTQNVIADNAWQARMKLTTPSPFEVIDVFNLGKVDIE